MCISEGKGGIKHFLQRRKYDKWPGALMNIATALVVRAGNGEQGSPLHTAQLRYTFFELQSFEPDFRGVGNAGEEYAFVYYSRGTSVHAPESAIQLFRLVSEHFNVIPV